MHKNTDPAGPRSAPSGPVTTGFRTGLFAAPMYLLFVGAGHIWLERIMSSEATGPRDGQAFIELFFFGVLAIVLGVITLPIAVGLSRERGVPLLRAAVVALVIAGAVVAYTASRGVERGGVVGVVPCIVEFGREICMQGDGTYIKGSRLDVTVMFLGTVFAYAAAHVLGRRWPRT